MWDYSLFWVMTLSLGPHITDDPLGGIWEVAASNSRSAPTSFLFGVELNLAHSLRVLVSSAMCNASSEDFLKRSLS